MLTKAKIPSWGIGEVYTSAQSNHLQSELIKAIDGVGGGAYSPSALIEIGGTFGIEVTAPSNLEGDVSIGDNAGSQLSIFADTFVNRDIAFIVGMTATFNGTAAFTDDLSVTGAGTVDLFAGSVIVTAAGGLVIGGGFDIVLSAGANILLSSTSDIDINSGDILLNSASGLTVGGGVPANFGGTVGFDAAVNFAASSVVTFAAGSDLDGSVELGLTVTGAMSFASTATLAIASGAELQISGILRDQGTGRTIYRRYNLPAANATVGINDGTLFIIPPLGGGGVVYTVSTTGAQAGDVICFSAYANTTANTAGVGAWNLNNTGAAGENPAVFFYYDGAAWQTLFHAQN